MAGDGARIMRQYAYLLLYCKADKSHSTKYALEFLYQLFLTEVLLSQRDREHFIWNRTVNNCGKKGKNIALGLHVEHSNNYVKQGIKNLGSNLNERSTNRICNAESGMWQIMENVDLNIHTLKARARTHTAQQKMIWMNWLIG